MTTPTPPPGIDPRLYELATLAYHRAWLGDEDGAAQAVMTISDELGGEAVNTAMIAWADTTLHAQGITEYGTPQGPIFCDAETGQMDIGTSNVPPEIRWSGQLLAARAADDWDTWTALIMAIQGDPVVVGDHVFTFLTVCVTTAQMEGQP